MTMRKVSKVVFPLVSLFFLGFLFKVGLDLYKDFVNLTRPDKEWKTIKKGMTKEEVIRILGPPFRVFKSGEVARVNDYTFKPRVVKEECFAYMSKNGVYMLYIYFDERGRVEDIFIGGT